VEVKRPGIITLFAAMQFAGAVFWLCLAAVVASVLSGVHVPFLPTIIVGMFCSVAIALQVVCGLGLWKLRGWARIMQMILACFGLLLFPIGTLVAALMLVYLAHPGVRLIFSGRPIAAMTADEQAHVSKIFEPSSIRKIIAIPAVAVVALAWIALAAVLVPLFLRRAVMAANEQGAIEALSSLAAAQASYASECGRGGFAASFEVLDTLPDATIPASQGIAGPIRGVSGYWISLQQAAGTATGPVDCHGVPTVTGWYAKATPQRFQGTGRRSFAMTDAGVMWQSFTVEPPTEPFGPPALPVTLKER
jgi:hypothetical protein